MYEKGERHVNEKKSRVNVKTITVTAMLCAIAFAAKLISNMIPIMVAGFLEFDLKDVVIAIAGFVCGPLSAAAISVIVSLIEMVTISGTGPIGFVMNALSSCSFACVAAVIYKKKRTMRGAVLALASGTAVMTAVMLLWNYLVTPLYMGVARAQVAAMLAGVFLPFNLVKGGMNAALTMLLYKPVVTALRRADLAPVRVPDNAQETGRTHKINPGVMLVSLVLLITFILLALVLAGRI